MLKCLLQKSLIHPTKNVDTLVLECAAPEEVSWLLHFCAHLPRDFLVQRGILKSHVGKCILTDFDGLHPLVLVGVVATDDINVLVSHIDSGMTDTTDIKK